MSCAGVPSGFPEPVKVEEALLGVRGGEPHLDLGEVEGVHTATECHIVVAKDGGTEPGDGVKLLAGRLIGWPETVLAFFGASAATADACHGCAQVAYDKGRFGGGEGIRRVGGEGRLAAGPSGDHAVTHVIVPAELVAEGEGYLALVRRHAPTPSNNPTCGLRQCGENQIRSRFRFSFPSRLP